MWRHYNMCSKWPPFASRQDWTRRAIFWKVLASTSAITAWISSVMFAFKATMVHGLVCLSDIPIRNNQAASDRASAVAKVPSKWRGRRKRDWISAMLACEVGDVAPSCWKYPIESSSSSNWFTKVLKISIYAAVVMVASKKMGPIMRRRYIPHQTPIFSEWRGSSCIALGFSLAQIREFRELTYHDR